MSNAHFDQAYSKHISGNRQSARMLYERIIRKNPDHLDARYMLGTLLAESGVFELGLMHLNIAAKLKPDSHMVFTNIGHVYFKLGKLDQAVSSYRHSLRLQPRSPEILFNLGVIFHRQGKLEEARENIENCLEQKSDYFAAYKLLSKIYGELHLPALSAASLIQLLEFVPNSIEVLFDLGNLLAAHRDYENAGIYFKRILDIDPGNESARHAVAALAGETTTAAPLHHVEKIFDDLSASFESHLGQLGYNAPEILKQMIISAAEANIHFDHALDLGCGTGLSGIQFRPMVSHLTGLDISQNMVDEARTKGLYDVLEKSDLGQYLEKSPKQFDLFIATDVFPYLGDLTGTFSAIARHANPASYFIFSTEMAMEQDYILRTSGRFAHSRKYIETLAENNGFSVAASRSIDLRKEGLDPIKGELFVLKFMEVNTTI